MKTQIPQTPKPQNINLKSHFQLRPLDAFIWKRHVQNSNQKRARICHMNDLKSSGDGFKIFTLPNVWWPEIGRDYDMAGSDTDQKAMNAHFAGIVISKALNHTALFLIYRFKIINQDGGLTIVARKPLRVGLFRIVVWEHPACAWALPNSWCSYNPIVIQSIQIWVCNCAESI